MVMIFLLCLFSILKKIQMHYLMFGSGFQTWEYSPKYAIRSYAYVLLHTIPGKLQVHLFEANKVRVVLKCLWSKKYLVLTLKILKNDDEWCFLFWNIFSHCRDIQVFVQKSMTSQTVINHKIENISENIGWVLYKRGSGNLRQIRHKMIPLCCCHGNLFLLLGLFDTGLILSFIVVIRHVHSW